jgi:acetyl-CoA C-acetyltransferase
MTVRRFVVLTSAKAEELGLKPMAKIISQINFSQKPEWFTTAPAYAIEKICTKSGISKEEIDLFEINEAFAVVSCAVNQIAGLDNSKVNVTGGAIAFGHQSAHQEQGFLYQCYNLKG